MDTVKQIRQHGFRHWYQAELLRGHGHLLLLLLCVVALLVALEALGLGLRQGERAELWLCILAAAALAAYALHGYVSRMSRAEFVARQADCPACAAHARWEVEAESACAEGGTRLRVSCRACGERWHIRC